MWERKLLTGGQLLADYFVKHLTRSIHWTNQCNHGQQVHKHYTDGAVVGRTVQVDCYWHNSHQEKRRRPSGSRKKKENL